MNTKYLYPVTLSPPSPRDGRVTARIPDLEGCVTDGADEAEALAEAADALEEALAVLIAEGRDAPAPSPARGRPCVAPGAVIAAKAALGAALRASGLSQSALARRLGVAEGEVRRMLDPRHATKIGRLEDALAALGRRLTVTVDDAA